MVEKQKNTEAGNSWMPLGVKFRLESSIQKYAGSRGTARWGVGEGEAPRKKINNLFFQKIQNYQKKKVYYIFQIYMKDPESAE